MTEAIRVEKQRSSEDGVESESSEQVSMAVSSPEKENVSGGGPLNRSPVQAEAVVTSAVALLCCAVGTHTNGDTETQNTDSARWTDSL